eukprot:Seg2093.3 transcript_id=Seg2093.3/GoldUCD/mRNA.D3Y31 product="hypothetical protein" protein_id=Seg2093.3/GoldUCD/D3Y31
MDRIMADLREQRTPENNEASSADQLLNFVSNASRELKDMLGKVDNDEKPELNQRLLSPSFNSPATPMMSPIPSPSPSCVSSMSDQEVPSMSPRFFAINPQKRARKRSFDSSGEAPFLDYPMKVGRSDSVGESDEYYPSCALRTRNQRTPQKPQCWNYRQPYPMYQKQQCQKQQYQNFPTLHQLDQYPGYERYQQLSTCQQQTSNVYSSNQQNFPAVNNNFGQSYSTVEQTPDFADLVSWMLAEDFLDAETLSSLLSRC